MNIGNVTVISDVAQPRSASGDEPVINAHENENECSDFDAPIARHRPHGMFHLDSVAQVHRI